MKNLMVVTVLGALASCAPVNSLEVPGCLEVSIGPGQNVEYLIDDLGILPARRFAVRLDSVQVSTWTVSGNRLGIPASPEAQLAAPATWLAPTADSLVLVWWGGYDGVFLQLAREPEGFVGRGLQEDDVGCPGSEYCYSGAASATLIECPSVAWLQADSSGWVAWRQ